MPEPNLSKFLTAWFYFDAAMNIGCAVVFYIVPRWFFEGIGGPYGHEITDNMDWAVRTQATYFAIAAGCMITAGRSECATTRRRLAKAFMIPGLVMWAPAIALRSRYDGRWESTWIIMMISAVVVTAPYFWYAFIRHEDQNFDRSQSVEPADDDTRALLADH